jgi:dTMP kinase
MDKKRGRLIVIDGGDGSGKTTQLGLLAEKLTELGYDIETVDFPQYGQKSAGLVEEYLNGRYGTAEEVGPYCASLFYALDRYDASFQLRKWLDEGKIILSNRYVASNMAHQGGKIANDIERQIYFRWLHDLEHNICRIPRPDLNIILHVSCDTAQKLALGEDSQARKKYLSKSGSDIHESSPEHLQKAEKIYLEIADTFDDFAMVECMKDGKILAPNEIHEKVFNIVMSLIK